MCVICGTVQSMHTLIEAGAGKTEDDVEKYLGFSCVGRFMGRGGHKKGDPPGKGCDWTLGGLFRLHKLEVESEGKWHPRFEVASPEQAQALMVDALGVPRPGTLPEVVEAKRGEVDGE